MTKKIQTTLLICSIAILLCLPSAFCNIGAYNPSAEDKDKFLHNDSNNHKYDTHNPHDVHNTKAEDDEEKEMLKELMGDFKAPDNHYPKDHHGNTYDDYTQHKVNSHDQLIHHTDTQTHNPEAGHHEDPHNAHNMQKSRNPLHDIISSEPVSDIKEVQIKADGTDHYFNVQSCTLIKIPVHHGSVDVDVACLGNSDKAMLTTSLLHNCTELMQFHCPNETAFCKVHDLMHETDIKLEHAIADADVAYLYILPHKISQELAFKVKVTPIKSGIVVQTPENHDPCHSRNYDTCKEHVNPCHSRCAWASCGYWHEGDINVAAGSCFTTGTDENVIIEYCMTFSEFRTASQPALNFPTCAYTPDPSQAHSVAFVAFVVCSVLFMACVCFYRYQFRKYGSGFFTPPRWCPRFLFPSKEGELTTSFYKDILKSQETEMNYQPPVL